MKKVVVIFLLAIFLAGCDNKTTADTITPTILESSPTNIVSTKIIADETICSQISQEFVAKVTEIEIARTGTINDTSITACDFYLTNEEKSPYIAIVLNKNLDVEVQKSFVLKQKLVIGTDPRIETDHYVVTAPIDGRIVNINLVLNPTNFIRIDKNVERAIDNEGMIKLASAIAERL